MIQKTKILTELNIFEDELIEKFKQHPFFSSINNANWSEIQSALLQRRFLSLIFTPIYDMVTDALDEEEAKKIVRHLIREEYPIEMPSHREDLVYDLKNIGIPMSAIFSSTPSETTKHTIDRSFQMVYSFSTLEHASLRNLGLLLMVRFWGEILVSTEYSCFWSRLSEKINPKNSRFYYQHYLHDQKKQVLQSTPKSIGTHADRTNIWISNYINSEESIDFFRQTESLLWEIKYNFYNQFL